MYIIFSQDVSINYFVEVKRKLRNTPAFYLIGTSFSLYTCTMHFIKLPTPPRKRILKQKHFNSPTIDTDDII